MNLFESGKATGIATVLIAAGIFLFAGQVVDLSSYMWPLFVIFPGILLFTLMASGGKSAAGLAVPASIITAVGLILFSQNVTGRFETWSYAWGLILAAIGMGTILQGRITNNDALQSAGSKTVMTGMVFFLVFAAFFELLIFQSWTNSVIGRNLFPLALIAAGFIFWRYRANEMN